LRNPPQFVRLAWAVLAFNVAVVLWGAYVRATGSGAGCGNHWPLCNGVVVPLAPSVNTQIEFTHRATSGIDVALVALLVVWAFRAFPRGHRARLGATLSAIFLATEALIGAALVKLEHVAQNPSAYRGISLSTHLVNTLTLLACLAMTAWWGMGRPPIAVRGRAAWLAGISLGAVVLLGITGVIAALGDTLFPAKTFAEGLARDLDPAANIFLRLRALHPVIAALAGCWICYYAVSCANRRTDARRQAWWTLGLLGAQLSIGMLNLALAAPIWLQMVHLLAADLFWISLVLLCAQMLKAGAPPADV
jgi:heme A synthase